MKLAPLASLVAIFSVESSVQAQSVAAADPAPAGRETLSSAPVGASPAPRSKTSEYTITDVYVERSYAAPVAIVYGSGYVVLAAGLALARPSNSQGVRTIGAVTTFGGGGTLLFGAMLVHWHHNRLGAGFASAGGQVGAALLGAVSGYGIGKAAGADDTGDAVLAGAIIGHVAWATFDVLVLANERLLRERTTSGGVRFGVEGDARGASATFTASF